MPFDISSVTLIVIIITSLISIAAFNNADLKYKALFYPYKVKRENEFYRIFSHFFVHADYLHLIFNMFVLYSFGTAMEFTFQGEFGTVNGKIHFLILYILGGVVASVWPYIRNKDNPDYLSLGASGAVSAVLFASILWHPDSSIYLFFIPIPIPAWLFGLLYLFFEYYMSKKGGSKIAHDAHFGGAVFGIFYILLIKPEVALFFGQYISNLLQ